jgi:hypothetical protein
MKLSRALAPAALWALFACGSDPSITSVTVNPTTVAAGGTVTMTVAVADFEIGEHHEGLSAHGLRAADGEAEEEGGHIHVYLDTTNVNPLVQTASTSFPVPIPGGTSAGAHNLIVRLHNGDHTILEPEVSATAPITVQ